MLNHKKDKKKNNIVLIISLLILPILGNVLFEFYTEYRFNKIPLEISYSDWISAPPTNKYLKLNDVKANAINSIYIEKLLTKDNPVKIFIPLIPKDSEAIQNEKTIVLSVDKGPLYDMFTELLSMEEEDILNENLSNPNKYKVAGPFMCYQRFNSEAYKILKEDGSILSSDFVIMELDGQFPVFAVIIPFLIFVLAIIFIVKELLIRFRTKSQHQESIKLSS